VGRAAARADCRLGDGFAINDIEEAIQDLRQRLLQVETRLEQLFEHLDIAPRAGKADGFGTDPTELDPNEDPEIQDLLAKGNETQAIKRYHELTGVSVGEAKQAIERAQQGG
jgi:ribosomal protein L7/L12